MFEKFLYCIVHHMHGFFFLRFCNNRLVFGVGFLCSCFFFFNECLRMPLILALFSFSFLLPFLSFFSFHFSSCLSFFFFPTSQIRCDLPLPNMPLEYLF